MACSDPKSLVVNTLSALVSVALLGCSSLPLSPGTALAQSSPEPPASESSAPEPSTPEPSPPAPPQIEPSALEPAAPESTAVEQSATDSQLMFELMIAEIALRRGQLDVALTGYASAAAMTDDPRVSERATRLAMFGRQWVEAQQSATRWGSLDPDSTDAPRLLAQSLLQQDKTDAAAEIYTKLLAENDERRQLLRDIQFELQQNDNPAVAVSIMQSLADVYTDEVEAYLGLARAHVTNNDIEAALLVSATAVDIAPADTDALLLRAQILGGVGNPDEAFAVLQNALEVTPDNTELRLGYARLLVEGGRYEQVDGLLETIFSESENNPDTLLTIGLLAVESKRLEQARTYLTTLLSTGEYSDQANFYLARISDEQQEFVQAIALYDAVNEGELQFNAQVRAAELTALVGNLDEGRSRLHELSSTVVNPAVQPGLVTAESRMLQNANQSAEAVLVLNEGLQRFPEDHELLYARALASNAAGDDETMIEDLERLLELDPDNAHAMNALGYHFADQNTEIDKAEQLLVKASELLPDDPAIKDSLGWLRFRQARYEEAIALLREAYESFPDPEIAAHLGEALWLSGAQGEARELIDEALQSSPEDERLLALQKNVIK